MRFRSHALAITAAVMAVAAWSGAIAMAFAVLTFSDEIEHRFPFHSPVFAAIALMLVVALPCTLAAILAWRGDERTARAGEVAGWLLVGWIIVEIAVIRAFSPLQPICLVLGLALVLLGHNAHKPSNEPGRRSGDR